MASNADLSAQLRLTIDPASAKAVQAFFADLASQSAQLQKMMAGGGAAPAGNASAAFFQQAQAAANQSAAATTAAATAQVTGAMKAAEATEAAAAATEDAAKAQVDSANQAAGALANINPLRPTRLAFSISEFARLTSAFGMQDVSKGLMGAGAVAGSLEALTQFNLQLEVMGTRLLNASGVVGTLARVGGDAALALGASGGGLVATLAGMATVIAPVVLIVGALALVMKTLSDNLAAADKAGTDYANAQLQINQQLSTGTTTADVQKQIKTSTDLRNLDQATLGQLQVFQSRADALQLNPKLNIFDHSLQDAQIALEKEISDATSGLVTSLDSLPAAIDASQTALDKDNASLNLWNAQLGSNQLKLNDRIKAEQDKAKVDADTSNAILAGSEAANKEIHSLTTKGLQDRLLAIAQEEQVIDRAYDNMNETQKANADLRFAQLDAEAGAITGRLIPALSDLQTAIDQNAAAVQKYIADSAKLQASYSEQTAATAYTRQLSAAREAQDFSVSRGRELAANALQQQRAAEDAQAQQAKTNLDTARQQEDLAAKIKKIWDDALLAMDDAVAARDALAYIKAQRAAAKQVADLNAQSQLDNQRKAQDAQIAAQDAAVARQRQADDFRQRLQQEDQDRALRLSRLQEDQMREDFLRQNAYAQQQAELVNQLNIQTGILGLMGQNVTDAVTLTKNGLGNILNTIGTGGGGSAGGGYFPGVISVPNASYSPFPTPYAGSRSITMNVQGATSDYIQAATRQGALTAFGALLDKVGVQ